MLRKIVAVIAGLIIGGFLGLVFGLIIGAFIGGNYMRSFVFNGAQGYEAVSQIGSFIGTPVGAVYGILLAWNVLVAKNRNGCFSWLQ